jgi:hypothetical protein
LFLVYLPRTSNTAPAARQSQASTERYFSSPVQIDIALGLNHLPPLLSIVSVRFFDSTVLTCALYHPSLFIAVILSLRKARLAEAELNKKKKRRS